MTVTVGQELGVCFNPGSAATGAACDPAPNLDDSWMTNTGCALGNACLEWDSSTYECVETCDFFGTPSCTGVK